MGFSRRDYAWIILCRVPSKKIPTHPDIEKPQAILGPIPIILGVAFGWMVGQGNFILSRIKISHTTALLYHCEARGVISFRKATSRPYSGALFFCQSRKHNKIPILLNSQN